jgi:hypothetical protein
LDLRNRSPEKSVKFSKALSVLSGLFIFAISAAAVAAVCSPADPWDKQKCGGLTGSSCDSSDVPTVDVGGSPSPLPAGVTFEKLVNPMAACCGLGWNITNGGTKLDCVEAIPPAAGILSFENFYMAGAAANDLTTTGLTYPNEFFLVSRDGTRPINGFYSAAGNRCNLSTSLSARNQLLLYRQAIWNNSLPTVPPIYKPDGTTTWQVDAAGGLGTPAATVPPHCCYLVTFALERKCPGAGIADVTAGGVLLTRTDPAPGSPRRCSAAEEMKVHFGIIDLCNPNLTKRPRFRTATSIGSTDISKTVAYNIGAIPVSRFLREFYPVVVPSPVIIPTPTATPPPPPPLCPVSPAIQEIPHSGGMCELVPLDP